MDLNLNKTAYHKAGKKRVNKEDFRGHGKKQAQSKGQNRAAGLSPENWLVIRRGQTVSSSFTLITDRLKDIRRRRLTGQNEGSA
jgi:sarcosine oxidase gamma subunit